MPSALLIENIEEMRRREGIEDDDLREAIGRVGVAAGAVPETELTRR